MDSDLQLDRVVARRIIESVGGSGTPPEYGFQFFTAGLDPYLSVLDEEYLATHLKDGGAVFKLVVGPYGGGKTHFLYLVRELAWTRQYAVSYVSLSPKESPFSSLDRVYAALMRGIAAPLTPQEMLRGWESGFPAFLKRWFAGRRETLMQQGVMSSDVGEHLLHEVESVQVENVTFRRAVIQALHALLESDAPTFDSVCQWLLAEGYDARTHRPLHILQRIDPKTAPSMIRSLAQFVRQVGYTGLVILLDEAERMSSMSTRQRDSHLSNLREIIDECGHTNLQGVLLLFAVPDLTFLEGKTQIYDALNQRVATVFEDFNPSGVRIELDKIVKDARAFLLEVGAKLARVHQCAYQHTFEPAKLEETVSRIADYAYGLRFGDVGYKRAFVQSLVRGLDQLRRNGEVPDPSNWSSS